MPHPFTWIVTVTEIEEEDLDRFGIKMLYSAKLGCMEDNCVKEFGLHSTNYGHSTVLIKRRLTTSSLSKSKITIELSI